MKITNLNLYLVRPRWCFLEMETDEGITGWGEPVLEGHCDAVKACVEEMKPYLIGHDPSRIEDIWSTIYRAASTGARRADERHRPASIRPCGTSRARSSRPRSISSWGGPVPGFHPGLLLDRRATVLPMWARPHWKRRTPALPPSR